MDVSSKFKLSSDDCLVDYKYLMGKFSIEKSTAYNMMNNPSKYNFVIPKKFGRNRRVLKSSVDNYLSSLFE